MDPSDGYAYALTRLEGEEAEFLLERQSVGLPGLGGVVSPPGTWEPRQVITVKPAVWDTLKGRCTYRCVAPELLATPPPRPCRRAAKSHQRVHMHSPTCSAGHRAGLAHVLLQPSVRTGGPPRGRQRQGRPLPVLVPEPVGGGADVVGARCVWQCILALREVMVRRPGSEPLSSRGCRARKEPMPPSPTVTLGRSLITTLHPKLHEPATDPEVSVFRYHHRQRSQWLPLAEAPTASGRVTIPRGG